MKETRNRTLSQSAYFTTLTTRKGLQVLRVAQVKTEHRKGEPSKIELVNGFIAANFPHGYVVDWTGIEQPYFASHPEFGIAAEVVEADFYHA